MVANKWTKKCTCFVNWYRELFHVKYLDDLSTQWHFQEICLDCPSSRTIAPICVLCLCCVYVLYQHRYSSHVLGTNTLMGTLCVNVCMCASICLYVCISLCTYVQYTWNSYFSYLAYNSVCYFVVLLWALESSLYSEPGGNLKCLSVILLNL